jgi:hypothetical protein
MSTVTATARATCRQLSRGNGGGVCVAAEALEEHNRGNQAFLASARFWTLAPNSATGRDVSHSKPKIVGPVRAVCPVCGETAYSKEGIHPQCAASKADRPPRQLKGKAKSAKNASGLQWKKRCPRCSREQHVRRAVCDCGHSFQPRASEQSS